MKFFLYGVELDDTLLGTSSTSYLVQLIVSSTGGITIVIKTSSSLPDAASKFADIILHALSFLVK